MLHNMNENCSTLTRVGHVSAQTQVGVMNPVGATFDMLRWFSFHGVCGGNFAHWERPHASTVGGHFILS